MKAGLIYTGTTPELIEAAETEVRGQIGADVELHSLRDPSILAGVREAGYVTAARLISMYMKAVQAAATRCSSVGEVADCVQDAARCLGVPIVRVDEEMCREAVRRGSRIGVMATLAPAKNTVAQVAREAGKAVEIVDCPVDGAFGLDQQPFRARLIRGKSSPRGEARIYSERVRLPMIKKIQTWIDARTALLAVMFAVLVANARKSGS